MESETRIAKYGLRGREVGRDRGDGQTKTGDVSSAIEIIFTCPGKTQ